MKILIYIKNGLRLEWKGDLVLQIEIVPGMV